MDSPKILIIDSYDSFTYNLAALVASAIPSAELFIIKNDEIDQSTLTEYLSRFSAVIVGPGPGSPENPVDVGVVKELWHVADQHILPIFGVCLGLQSLAVEFGATLRRLNVVKHGQVSAISHHGSELFEGVGQAEVVRYHSLHVELADTAPKLQELAWADDGAENGRVIMAIRHRTRPFWGVQYHPESVRTDASGLDVIRNFWNLAMRWWSTQKREVMSWDAAAASQFGQAWPYSRIPTAILPPPKCLSSVSTTTVHLPQLSVLQICETMGVHKKGTNFVLLDSAANPGQHSIIGCLSPSTLKITYFVGDKFVTLQRSKGRFTEMLGAYDIWSWLASFMRAERATGGHPDVPFWGGLVGYFSYELGVDSLDCDIRHRTSHRQRRHPDVSLVFVERSIVVDCAAGNVFIQSLVAADDDWMAATKSTLERAASQADIDAMLAKPVRQMPTATAQITLPDKDRYIEKVKLAKEQLFAGESYELCVTARTHIDVPKSFPNASQSSTSWELYKRLRKVNPAPYASYLRLHPTTLVSSSPERFLSFSRSPFQKCQLRPIKGTVRKGPGVTPALVEQILGSPKEVAENLMIVDLIRHDLHGVVGNNVQVTKFCGIEEFSTVWQLVSVIEGSHSTTKGKMESHEEIGWDVLKSSFPPGSMTGAPKKRSVEILQELEDDERAVYSGVAGFYCVSGSGDWSVTIRSCFNYDESDGVVHPHATTANGSQGEAGVDRWTLGAGGAITALSDPEAEWEEMTTKLQSVLRAFGPEAI